MTAVAGTTPAAAPPAPPAVASPPALAAAGVDPATGPAVAVAGTFLLAATFYALTAHVAARWVLGSVPFGPAVGVGVALAAVAFLLRAAGPAPVIAVSLAVDAAAIRGLYGLDWRPTAMVALAHYTVAAIVGLTLFNLVRLLGTAPG